MLSTSLPDIAFFFHRVIAEKRRPTPMAIVSVVFLFVFALDIVGSILFHADSSHIARD